MNRTAIKLDAERDRFHNSAGRLTVYALACGYRETAESDDGRRHASLSHSGGVGYHIQAFDRETGGRIWDCAPTLTKARRRFDTVAAGLATSESFQAIPDCPESLLR